MSSRALFFGLVGGILVGSMAVGCGDDDAMPMDSGPDTRPRDSGVDTGPPDAGSRDWPGGEAPTTRVVRTGVRRDDVLLPGAVPPANPTTGEATPDELDKLWVLRYRQDVTPAAQARAVVVGMAGLLGGAASFEGLATNLVARSVEAGEPIEVWVIERRSNLLEDTRGMDAAEVAENPEIALGYYTTGDTIDGVPFGGYVDPEEVTYMSEWGLGMHVDEMRSLIEHIPAAERAGRVFLLGHGDSAEVMDHFAGWRFADGVRGAELIAGMVLVDADTIDRTDKITEDQYLDTEGITINGLATIKGLNLQRSDPDSRLVEIPLLGVELFPLAEILAMRAHFQPNGVVDDIVRDSVYSLLLDLEVEEIPSASNLAHYGFAFDADFAAFTLIGLNMGKVVGPTESYFNFLLMGDLLHPSDPTATYTWLDGDGSDPQEVVNMRDVVAAATIGKTNLFDWYHPMRLTLDLLAARGGSVPEDGYQAANGIRAFDTALNDAPVLAVTAARQTRAGYETYRDRLAATIGAGRRNEGAVRATDDAAFRVIELSGMTHQDPMAARDVEGLNPLPREMHAFILANSSTGTIDVSLE